MTEAGPDGRRVAVATDADVAALSADRVVAVMARALRAHGDGRLVAPPREAYDIGATRLVLTVGGLRDGVAGFRAYDTYPAEGDQLVAVWDPGEQRLVGVVVGSELGPRRTGAIGAVAADALAPESAAELGLVGAGRQAWAHLWALHAVRPLRRVRVYSRSRERAAAFAQRCTDELSVAAETAATPEDAVEGAPLVTLATSSGNPVVRADAVADGAHVTTVGPKALGRHELPLPLAARAATIVSDSRAQLLGFAEPFVLSGTPHLDKLVDLGDVLAGRAPGRRSPGELTLFVSAGLAGTEVLLAAEVLRRLG